MGKSANTLDNAALNFLLPHQFHKVCLALSWPILRLTRAAKSPSPNSRACRHVEMDPCCLQFSITSFLKRSLHHSSGTTHQTHGHFYQKPPQEKRQDNKGSGKEWRKEKQGHSAANTNSSREYSKKHYRGITHHHSDYLLPSHNTHIQKPLALCHNIKEVFVILLTDNFICKQCPHTHTNTHRMSQAYLSDLIDMFLMDMVHKDGSPLNSFFLFFPCYSVHQCYEFFPLLCLTRLAQVILMLKMFFA